MPTYTLSPRSPWEVMAFLFVLLPTAMYGAWRLVSWIFLVLSGWRWLARAYRFEGDFRGETWPMASARLGLMSYGWTLGLGANSEGLYLDEALFSGHPPLFIPWGQIAVREYGGLLGQRTEFVFQQVAFVPLSVSRRLGDEILAQRQSRPSA